MFIEYLYNKILKIIKANNKQQLKDIPNDDWLNFKNTNSEITK